MKSRNSAKLNRLTDPEVRSLVKAGPKGSKADFYHDGGGLYLKVTRGAVIDDRGKVIAPGTASWVFRYAKNGKPRYPGLGTYLGSRHKTSRIAR